jgi:hypothetical protein
LKSKLDEAWPLQFAAWAIWAEIWASWAAAWTWWLPGPYRWSGAKFGRDESLACGETQNGFVEQERKEAQAIQPGRKAVNDRALEIASAEQTETEFVPIAALSATASDGDWEDGGRSEIEGFKVLAQSGGASQAVVLGEVASYSEESLFEAV